MDRELRSARLETLRGEDPQKEYAVKARLGIKVDFLDEEDRELYDLISDLRVRNEDGTLYFQFLCPEPKGAVMVERLCSLAWTFRMTSNPNTVTMERRDRKIRWVVRDNQDGTAFCDLQIDWQSLPAYEFNEHIMDDKFLIQMLHDSGVKLPDHMDEAYEDILEEREYWD